MKGGISFEMVVSQQNISILNWEVQKPLNIITCEVVRSAFEKENVLSSCFIEFFFLQCGFSKVTSFPLKRIFRPLASMARNLIIKMQTRSIDMYVYLFKI